MSNRMFMITLMIIYVYLILFYLLFEYYIFSSESSVNNYYNRPFLPYVVVHLDLKGAPPKISYLKSLLPMLKSHGANGLLIEYEDMFPYEGRLINLSALNCYSKRELTSFLSYARDLNFEIIPLLQTFGHMEFVLKLKEYANLREKPDYPDSICPSRANSKVLISEMIHQIMNLHNSVSRVKYIHIGCDEVYNINLCERCRRRKLSNEAIFTQHVISVAKGIKSQYPNTTILIWDDMLRPLKPFELKNFNLRGQVELVYWNYEPILRNTHINLFKYGMSSDNTWVASAFKGADGRTATLPNMTARYLNHLSWMNLINDYRIGSTTKAYSFKGIILTGWSRYGHMETLCELLPVSVPSLILCLEVIKAFKTETYFNPTEIHEKHFYDTFIRKNLYHSLKCSAENITNIEDINLKQCEYKENKIHSIVNVLNKTNTEFLNDLVDLYVNGVIQQLGTLRGDISPSRLKYYEKGFKSKHIRLVSIEEQLKAELKEYFDHQVIEEYVTLKIQQQKLFIEQMIANIRSKYVVSTWQRSQVSPPPILPAKCIFMDYVVQEYI